MSHITNFKDFLYGQFFDGKKHAQFIWDHAPIQSAFDLSDTAQGHKFLHR